MTKLEANPESVNAYDVNHNIYDKYRPNFEGKIVDDLLRQLDLIKGEYDQGTKIANRITTSSSKTTNTQDKNWEYDNDKIILELAVGTGKFTQSLFKRGWGSKKTSKGVPNLIAVEPSKGMLETFKQNFPQVDSRQGSSYSIPIDDNSVDVIIIAQAFHWFADENSLNEFKRILKPNSGGIVGMIWNYDYPSKAQILTDPTTPINFIFDDYTTDIGLNALKELTTTNSNDSNDDAKELPKSLGEKIFGTAYGWDQLFDYRTSFDEGVPQYRKEIWRNALSSINQTKEINSSNHSNKNFKIIHENFSFKYTTIPRDDVFNYWTTMSYIEKKSKDEKLKIKLKGNQLLDDIVKNYGDSIYSDKDNQILKKFNGTHAIALQLI